MLLDRDSTENNAGKYAIVNIRKIRSLQPDTIPNALQIHRIKEALKTLEDEGVLEYGPVGSKEEFFVLKLKDINTPAALLAYAASAEETDREYALEIMKLRQRAGKNHPDCKQPD